MAAFTGKVPSLKPKETAPVAVTPAPTPPKASPTSGFKLPSKEVMLEKQVEQLKESVKKLELKVQIDAHYHEGTSENDKTYIKQLQETVASQKKIIHSLTIQNENLRRDFEKLSNVNY